MEQSSPPWRVFEGPASGGSARDAPWDPPRQGNLRLAVAGATGAVAIGALAVLIAIGGSGEIIAGPETGFGTFGTAPPGAQAGLLVIDVTGAVVAPGLYRLPAGSRVGDAVDAAGGFSPRVDAERVGAELNLAAALSDGGQVRVPSRDDVAPDGGSEGGGSGEGGGGGGGSLIDLNSATQSELESLPGIGPVTAEKIMASRAESAFRTVDELRERGLVGEKTFEDIRPLVTVR